MKLVIEQSRLVQLKSCGRCLSSALSERSRGGLARPTACLCSVWAIPRGLAQPTAGDGDREPAEAIEMIPSPSSAGPLRAMT